MKTIGLLGGMSWESTRTYYEYINIIVKKKLGGLNSAKIILSSVNFEPIQKCLKISDWITIKNRLIDEATKIENAKADCLLLCTNTMHKTYSEINKVISIPFFHIAQALGEKLQADNITKIGLIGTKFTMEENFISEYLKSNFGIETIVPSKAEIIKINDIIFSELCLGIIKDQSRDEYVRAINNMASKNIKALVLGCTEIDLLIQSHHHSLPMYDTTYIHSEYAVNWALN